MQWDELETALRTRHEARKRERTIAAYLIGSTVVVTLLVAVLLWT